MAYATTFFQPIDDRELPHLAQRMLRGARSLSLIHIVPAVVFPAIAWVNGETQPARAALLACLYGGTFAASYGLTYLERARARPFAHALLLMLLLTVMISTAGVMTGAMRPVVSYGIAGPVVASTVFPWQPRWSLLLGAVATGLPILVAPHDIAVSLPLYLFLGATFTATAAVSNQVQRHVWREFEQTRLQLMAFDRMSTLGRMVAGIAHEMKTPNATAANSLARIKALSTELTESIGRPEVTRDDLGEIAKEVQAASDLAIRATKRIDRFLQTLRAQTLGMNEADVVEFRLGDRVGNAVALLDFGARRANIRVDFVGNSTVTATGDPGKFEQVITNLVSNGIEACSEARSGSFVRVAIDRRDKGVRIAIDDDGPGVPAKLGERIFDPLFTTRTAKGGTGLGLSICRDVIEGAFGGTLRLVASPIGARFEIWLPDGGAVTARRAGYVPAVGAV